MDFSNYVALLPEIILTVTAVAILLTDLWLEEGKERLAYLGAAGSLAALVAVGQAGSVSGEIFAGMLFADGFSLFFKLVLTIVALLVTLMSVEYVAKRRIPAGEYYAIVLFSVVGMMFMASGADLITLYLGLELAAIATFILAGLLLGDRSSNEAAIKFLLNSAMATAITLFGFSIFFGLTGSTNLGAIAEALGGLSGGGPLVLTAVLFVVTGLGFKVAAVPFHLWTPDTYEGAPTPVTALLSTGSKLGAFAMIMRIFFIALEPLTADWSLAFAVLAVITMTVGNVTALLQSNIKRLMAYSSVGQLGYVLVGIAVATQAGLQAVLFYLLALTFVELGVFSAIVGFSNESGSDVIDDYVGLAGRSPILALSLVVFFLSLIGVPPFAGFIGKLNLWTASIGGGLTWLAIAIAVNSVISLGYYFGVVRNMYLVPVATAEATGDAGTDSLEEAGSESETFVPSWGVQLTLSVALVLTILLGIFPQPFLDWVGQAALYL